MRNLADRYEINDTTHVNDTLIQALHDNIRCPNRWLPEQSKWTDSILTGRWYVSIIVQNLRNNLIDEKYN